MASLAKYKGKFRQKSFSPFSSLFPRWGEKSYLSLDIGSSSVKMLEIRGDGNDMRILNADIASLPANAVQSNMVQDGESVTRAIRMLVVDSALRQRMGNRAREGVVNRTWPGAFRKFWAATEV